jgi:hypothetical protein
MRIGYLFLVLKQYGLTCVSPATVYRWMIRLGFLYQPTCKGYYVDGHKRPATIQYRWDFCRRFFSYERRMHRWVQVTETVAKQLEKEDMIAKGSGYSFCRRYFSYERRMHRWVQVTETVAKQLEKEDMIAKGSGYSYLTNDSTPMREYHVDSFDPKKSKEFLEQIVTTEFGGNLSVRIQPSSKPLISFGHDECIFKQFPTPTKQWYGPNKETFIRPKDDGHGIMISAFQSREFGFGLDVTEADLKEVNR